MKDHEPVRWIAKARVDKYRDGESTPYETYEEEGNLLMYGGASAIWDTLIGAGNVDVFDGTNCHIGVGDSSAAAVATQTDLQATTNKHREILDAPPTHTDGTTAAAASCVFTATFETGDANFAWNEWGLFNAASSGRMLNRKVFNAGTKTSADSWVFTVTLTVA